MQVLVLITCGAPNLEIADELFLGVNTVKTYIRTAYRKIGAARRSHAVLWDYRNGLFDPELAKK